MHHAFSTLLKQATLAVGLTGVTMACATANVATNIPVLIVAEDQDRGSVNHCNEVHSRVVGELRGSMQGYGFQMLDEQSIRATLGWNDSCQGAIDDEDRRSKHLLISDIKRMMSANEASVPVRAWALYRIVAQRIPAGSGHDVQVRLNGELYDAQSNQYLDSFQMKRLRFPLPDNCNRRCVYEILGDNASDIAINLGDILARKLERYSPAQYSSQNAVDDWDSTGSSSRTCSGLLTPYNITLRRFDRVEASTIASVMADEFPCYHSHSLKSGGEVVRKYAYQTRAQVHKLEEWLAILLADMGFKSRDYVMEISGNSIDLSKIQPTPDRPRSSDEDSRFN